MSSFGVPDADFHPLRDFFVLLAPPSEYPELITCLAKLFLRALVGLK